MLITYALEPEHSGAAVNKPTASKQMCTVCRFLQLWLHNDNYRYRNVLYIIDNNGKGIPHEMYR
jgi:hypothetical protein